MSQEIFSNINPDVTTGLMLATLLDDFKDALMSGLSGETRPLSLQPGGMWIDTSLQDAPDYTWVLRMYDGDEDVAVITMDVINGRGGFALAADTFSTTKISADAVGPIVDLIKNRLVNSGQVLADDLIARLRMTGRDNVGGDPIVAYFQATATGNQTVSENGVILSFFSTPAGSNAIAEHLKFAAGIVESVKSHKFNAIIWGQDQIASATDIVATSDKLLSEITGAVASTIHGIEVNAVETQYKVIVNSTAVHQAIKHESSTASAEQRFKLPFGLSLSLPAAGSITFYYCTTDARWKYLAGALSSLRVGLEEYSGGYIDWVAPVTAAIRIMTYPDNPDYGTVLSSMGMGRYNAFAWGANANGQLGVGNVTPRSSPVAILGGLALTEVRIGDTMSYGVSTNGDFYAWGNNQFGNLGLGDVTPRSSPVAVLGGRKFARTEIGAMSLGATDDGVLYSWGNNVNGQLGLGDVTSRSSPVAVLLGKKYLRFFVGYGGEACAFAIERDTGLLYAWGQNASGRLGLGDTTPRSSPVAVLGSNKYCKVAIGTNSAVGLKSNGGAVAWGTNANGQLGVGDVTSRSSPVAVLGGLTFKDVCNNGASYFGLAQDGTLYAWGNNDKGQLGVGDAIPRSSPVAVLGGYFFADVVINSNSKAIMGVERGTGLLYAWGENNNGQLGIGDVTARSSPVAVLVGKKFTEVWAGENYFYGFANDGFAYAWGANANGQLGVGDVTPRSSPVAVLGTIGPLPLFPKMIFQQVIRNSSYVIQMGAGRGFFNATQDLGVNVRRVTIAYET